MAGQTISSVARIAAVAVLAAAATGCAVYDGYGGAAVAVPPPVVVSPPVVIGTYGYRPWYRGYYGGGYHGGYRGPGYGGTRPFGYLNAPRPVAPGGWYRR